MNQEQQEANFQHLKHCCEVQVQVRNCEIEGSAFDLESKIDHCSSLEMISLYQQMILLDILKGT